MCDFVAMLAQHPTTHFFKEGECFLSGQDLDAKSHKITEPKMAAMLSREKTGCSAFFPVLLQVWWKRQVYSVDLSTQEGR